MHGVEGAPLLQLLDCGGWGPGNIGVINGVNEVSEFGPALYGGVRVRIELRELRWVCQLYAFPRGKNKGFSEFGVIGLGGFDCMIERDYVA